MHKNRKDFLNEYKELCDKYQMFIMSEDPYCGLELYSLVDNKTDHENLLKQLNEEDEFSSEPIEYIMNETEDAYMRGNYPDDHWRYIAKFLLEVDGAEADGVSCVLNSKHMRWCNDFTGKTTFPSFVEYYNEDRNGVLMDLLSWSKNPY